MFIFIGRGRPFSTCPPQVMIFFFITPLFLVPRIEHARGTYSPALFSVFCVVG